MVPDTGAASFWRVYRQCIFGREGDQSRCRLRYLWLIRSQRKSSCEPGISQMNKSTVCHCVFSLRIKVSISLILIQCHHVVFVFTSKSIILNDSTEIKTTNYCTSKIWMLPTIPVWPLSGTWGSWPCVWAGHGPGRRRRRQCHEESCAATAKLPPVASACLAVLSHRWSNSLNPASACNKEEKENQDIYNITC